MSDILGPSSIEQHERQIDVISFEAYRQLCDEQSEAYRQVGLLSDESYAAAASDPDTIFTDTLQGRTPTLVPIELADGYDASRTKTLIGKEKVYLLAVPPASLHQSINIEDMDAAIVVESAHQDDVQDQVCLETQLTIDQSPVTVHQFEDPRIRREAYKYANLSLYMGRSFMTEPKNAEQQDGAKQTIKTAFDSEGLELIPQDGLSIFSGEDFKQHPELMEDLWDLFKDRFEWLGDYHPISMEDTREVFDSIVYADNTFMPLRFSKGKLVCAGIVMHDFDDCPWFKQDTSDTLNDICEVEGLTPMYFFGIAAKKSEAVEDKTEQNMQEVVKFHCKMAAKANKNFLVVFESSNMSSMYIPRMTKNYINTSGYIYLPDGIQTMATVDYWYVSADKLNTSQSTQPA